MKFGTTFYLSRVINNAVFSSDNVAVGKLRDIIVDLESVRPRAIAVKIKQKHKTVIADISDFSITKVHSQYRIECQKLREIENKEGWLCLVQDILDKQIVDMYGRKVVRVNDLRLVALSTGTYVVAFDVGFEGFLRRLGVAKPLKKLLRPFNVTIASNLLLWDEVETIDSSNRGIKLSNTYTKLSTLHPSDVADILEDLDRTTRLGIFSSLDVETAADVLEELEPDAQASVVENMTTNQAVDMLGRLPADEVADILDEISGDKADEILNAMDVDSRAEIQDLMGYPEDSVGSMMTTEMVAIQKNLSCADALSYIRTEKPEAEIAYYTFVVDEHKRLQGYITLRDLVIAENSEQIEKVMESEPITVYDDEDIDELLSKMTKYNLVVMPVVSRDDELLGTILLSDVVDHLLKSRRKR
ncbi:CBS domain-containing protein (plasmid) [Alicyclobacillus fastidiosus]|uniref:CBS domain-containing protein n=1 Tax=Alicyclobacillus fastidiosus TaxID=392011 RepID=A0ABY6ZQ38_9BACL|nr:CBS domain-containing protein [Alicyclobacillus fastidiosus]WAH44934.1 CBS domain-containing protein [Alicyclobacillus fastidiosus]GMA65587.1 membrane protein [Alicyclobacillus fastidiosus]GMA65703.1 membrane protein [Alicyclobacillus fastidiosus]